MSELKKFQTWAEERYHYPTTDSLDRYTQLLWNRRKDVNEQAIQKNILNFLKNEGFVTMKVIVAERAGILDIIACSKDGRYYEIEVKTPRGVTSKLQEARVERVRKNRGVSFVAYGYDDFLVKYKNSTVV